MFFFVGIYILIAVGAVMMFVGFLGCYGAIQESQCLLGTVSSSFVLYITRNLHYQIPRNEKEENHFLYQFTIKYSCYGTCRFLALICLQWGYSVLLKKLQPAISDQFNASLLNCEVLVWLFFIQNTPYQHFLILSLYLCQSWNNISINRSDLSLTGLLLMSSVGLKQGFEGFTSFCCYFRHRLCLGLDLGVETGVILFLDRNVVPGLANVVSGTCLTWRNDTSTFFYFPPTVLCLPGPSFCL